MLQAPVEPALPGHRVRPSAKQGGSREAAQGGIFLLSPPAARLPA